jgi:Ca2+-binding RTX toxin-like protein
LAGPISAQLNIVHNALASPTVINLFGTGRVNTAATGAIAISDSTPTETLALTFAITTPIADVDGLGVITHQWQRSNSATGTTWTNVGVTGSSTFTPTTAEVNRRLRVRSTFVDAFGAAETILSAETVVVGDFFPFGVEDNSTAAITNGNNGQDILFGGLGADTLSGNGEDDILSGDSGNDTVSGGAGNDVIRFNGTGDGFDAINGGAGTDFIKAMSDGTIIGLRNTFASVEEVNANGFANVSILGSTAADTLSFNGVTLVGITGIDGSGGNDTITGSSAADVITGGLGNDTMNGGAGNDTFLFSAGFGADTINAFDSGPPGGQDKLDISGLGISAFSFLLGAVAITQVGTSVRISIAGSTITLTNQVLANITIDDFILA